MYVCGYTATMATSPAQPKSTITDFESVVRTLHSLAGMRKLDMLTMVECYVSR